jgi:hypothetical protein
MVGVGVSEGSAVAAAAGCSVAISVGAADGVETFVDELHADMSVVINKITKVKRFEYFMFTS